MLIPFRGPKVNAFLPSEGVQRFTEGPVLCVRHFHKVHRPPGRHTYAFFHLYLLTCGPSFFLARYRWKLRYRRRESRTFEGAGTLRGWSVWTPLQGWRLFRGDNLGRCPRLACDRAFGPNSPSCANPSIWVLARGRSLNARGRRRIGIPQSREPQPALIPRLRDE